MSMTCRCSNIYFFSKFVDVLDARFFKYLYKIIVSQNQLDNADAQPIGNEITNFFNSTNAQAILNVKHMGQYKMRSGGIEANFTKIALHRKTCGLTWYRLRVRPNTCHSIANELAKTNKTFELVRTILFL